MKLKHILFLMIIAISVNLFAQSTERDEDRFFYSPDADSDLKVIMPEKSFSQKGFQYGAIFSPVYILEDNDDGQLGSYIINTKIWAKSYLWKNSFIYIRGKNSYMGIIKNEGVYSSVESDNVLDLDLAYLSMSSDNGNLTFSAGRKVFNIGTGLVLNGRGDGGEASWFGSIFSLNIMGLYTGILLKDNNPYGLSDKDLADGAKRAFGGGVGAFEFYNQKFYLFGLAQIDLSKEESGTKTKYNSQYYGAGVEGIVIQNLSYFAEFVYETGTSYVETTNDESSIAAYALNSGINYYIPVVLNPAIILQYAYGSGDKYRADYTNSTRPATATGDDTGFISFGTFSGGYALKPGLSNLHIMRAGVSIAPFSWSDSGSLKKMSLSGKYSYYMKDKKESGIKTGEAPNAETAVGQGVDVSLRWQMFYDLSLYVNYGLFLPGAAYEEKGTRNFVMAGINLSI